MATSSSAPNEPWGSVPEVRVSTGVPALDTILHGGLVGRRPYLVVGPSGTGKTTLALQFLCQGVREGERVLMVTLEEPPNEMKANHRALRPELEEVYVFDAIPDIMRYERAPFKDIATVRQSIRFRDVADTVRKSPELASVEVTLTALEQTIRTEIARYTYARIVIDSLTALQYFCMKGFDETAGAQSFLRFLSDLRVTTLLTVEAPLEDVETPERLLARGEIRLFRWELDGRTVRALGVEKFRGSPHDVRLHPYRIGPQGVDVNLDMTISRDTMRELAAEAPVVAPSVAVSPRPQLVLPSTMGPWTQDLLDLATVGADLRVVRELIQRASTAARGDQTAVASELLVQVRGEVASLVQEFSHQPLDISLGTDSERNIAARRLVARATEARVGSPPSTGVDVASLPSALDALLAKGTGTVPALSIPPVFSAQPQQPAPRVPVPSAPVSAAVPPAASVSVATARSMPPVPVAPAVDLSLAAARLPTSRVDEPDTPVVELPPPPGEMPASWESPALLPTGLRGDGSVSERPATNPAPRAIADAPPLPQPRTEVEFLTIPASPGSPASGVVRLPVHVTAPMIAVGASAGGSTEVVELNVRPTDVVEPARPPLPSIAASDLPRPVLRPVVIPPSSPASVPGRSRSARSPRRATRAVSVSVAPTSASPAGIVSTTSSPNRRKRRAAASPKKKTAATASSTKSEPAVIPAASAAPAIAHAGSPPGISSRLVSVREVPVAAPERADPSGSSDGPVETATMSPTEAPALQPKRRPARRRKAPPVTGAAPGSRPMAGVTSPGPLAPSPDATASSSGSSPATAPAVATPAPGPTTDSPNVERRE